MPRQPRPPSKNTILYIVLSLVLSLVIALLTVSLAVFFWMRSTYIPSMPTVATNLRNQLTTGRLEGVITYVDNKTIQIKEANSDQSYLIAPYVRITKYLTKNISDITVGNTVTIQKTTNSTISTLYILPSVSGDNGRLPKKPNRGSANKSELYTVMEIKDKQLTLTSLQGSVTQATLDADSRIYETVYGSQNDLVVGLQVAIVYTEGGASRTVRQILITPQ